MAGILTVDALQLGNSGSSTNNLVFKTNVDGSFVIARGNNGGVLTPILNIDANGKVTSVFDTAPAQLSLTPSGYSKLPNGLILQWGVTAYGTGSSTDQVAYSVSFPISFPSQCLSISTMLSGAGDFAVLSTKTVNGFSGITYDRLGLSNPVVGNIEWFALGN